jgi:peptide/nickel transport system substrate-binding protein
MNYRMLILVAIGLLTVMSCASAATPPAPAAEQPHPAGQPSRALRIIIRAEPGSVAGTILQATGITTATARRVFNAGLALEDGDSQIRPYLAEMLPQLSTESWRVFPDGRMETTYRLRPNLTWHDGKPVSAQDFVFAQRVYRDPAFGIAGSLPLPIIEEMREQDTQTLVSAWNRPYPKAGELTHTQFAPLPRHIVESIHEVERDNLPNHAFWTTEYVGAGPYRLVSWEPGAFLEATAFVGHALGGPKIERVQIAWSADANATLANLMAGSIDYPGDNSIRVEQGLVLDAAWRARAAGTVLYQPELPRFIQVQHRPEYASPPAVRDVRARRALAHAIDRPAINEALFDGKGITSDSLIFPTVPYFAEVERSTTRYPFEFRRSEQLMNEAGFIKDAGGLFADRTGARLNLEVRNIQSAQNDAERSIIADGWRRAGFEIEEDVFTPVQTRDGHALGTFRALSVTSAGAAREGLTLENLHSASISRPETRWIGQNRGGWSNAVYDGAVDAFLTSLDPKDQSRALIEAIKALTEELGVIPLHFNPRAVAYAAGLVGVRVRTGTVDPSWNIHEWELR